MPVSDPLCCQKNPANTHGAIQKTLSIFSVQQSNLIFKLLQSCSICSDQVLAHTFINVPMCSACEACGIKKYNIEEIYTKSIWSSEARVIQV